MSRHGKILVAVLVLAALALSLVSVMAQDPGVGAGTCQSVAADTAQEQLVDIDGSVPTGAAGINCTIHVVNGETAESYFAGKAGDNREVGTPRATKRVPLPSETYTAIYDSIDVYTLTTGGASIYGFFKEPVRVCFGVDQADADAMNVADPFDTANPLYVVFSDARYFQNAKGVGVNQPSRNLQVLNIVSEGLPLGYVCADIDVPGTVSMVNNLNVAANLSAEQPRPDRCITPADGSCKD